MSENWTYPWSAIDTFLRRISPATTTCLLVSGIPTGSNGYVQMNIPEHPRRTNTYLHHVAWELTHEQLVPDGHVVDHTCSVRFCVNPDHLELVTIAENLRRAHGRRTALRHRPLVVPPQFAHLIPWRSIASEQPSLFDA